MRQIVTLLYESRRMFTGIVWMIVAGLLASSGTLVVQGQGSCIARHTGKEYFRMPSSGFHIGSYTPYSDSSCTTELESDGWHGFSDGIVRASSRDSAIALCEQHGPAEAYSVGRWIYDAPNIWFCGPIQDNSGEDSVEDRELNRPLKLAVGKKSDGSVVYETVANRVNLPLTGLKLHAFDGMSTGIQFRRLDAWHIGIQSVLDMGFLDAVDVWSNIGRGYEVCFPQDGRIVFLDASTSPRALVHVEYTRRDGYTCASSDRAGTMVLVGISADGSAPTTTQIPGTDDSVDDAIELQDCIVTTLVNLRLRAAPWDDILDVIPRKTEVTAYARSKSWFNVTFDEANGWSAAWLVDSNGACEWSHRKAGAETEFPAEFNS